MFQRVLVFSVLIVGVIAGLMAVVGAVAESDCTQEAEAAAREAISELARDDIDEMIAHPTEKSDVYTVYLGARANYRTIEVRFEDEANCTGPSATVFELE